MVDNVKNYGGAVVGIVVGLTASVGGSLAGHWLDGSKDRDNLLVNTTTTVATLKISVDVLTDQVKRLTEQPYVRRDEFSDRLSGLEQRVSILEGQRQLRVK